MKLIKFARKEKSQKRFHPSKKFWIPGAIGLVIVVIPLLILGWMGLVPGLSNVMGSDSQRDLGVAFSQQSLTSFEQTAPLTFKDVALAPSNPANPSEKEVLTDPVSLQNVTLSQGDVTALIDSYHWSWMPVENIQVRFTSGTIEISGLLDQSHLQAFKQYISNGRSLNPGAEILIDWLGHFGNDAPIYIKANTFAADGFVSFKLEQAQIGRFNVPLSFIGISPNQVMSSNISATNLQVNSATLSDGELHFSGTYPSVVYVKK